MSLCQRSSLLVAALLIMSVVCCAQDETRKYFRDNQMASFDVAVTICKRVKHSFGKQLVLVFLESALVHCTDHIYRL